MVLKFYSISNCSLTIGLSDFVFGRSQSCHISFKNERGYDNIYQQPGETGRAGINIYTKTKNPL